VSTDPGREHFLAHFNDPEAVARYAEGPRRYAPGYDALHRMTGVLLAETVPTDAHILVLGAGGGQELKALAQAHPGWRFTGVDPAAGMLRGAEAVLGDLMARVDLVEGYIDQAPEGPFDGAVCLLTLHFLEAEERLRTVREIHRRLHPGAPFVAAHACLPAPGAQRDLWLSRYAAFAVASGAPAEEAEKNRAAVDASAEMMPPEQDAAILCDGGFADAELFYAALTWRGWVGHA